MVSSIRTAQLRGKRCAFVGLDDNDPYFVNVGDGIEADFAELAERFIADDHVCLDIGANIGITAMLMAQFVPDGRVIAVEAAPKVAALLVDNVKSNQQSNISVEHCAISDKPGDVFFHDNSAYGHIASEGVKVEAKTLSGLLEEQGIDRVDFIKIDVEGYESHILKQALSLINEKRSLVLFEFNSWALSTTTEVFPLEFARWVLKSFSHVYAVRRGNSPADRLERIPADGALRLLELNMMHDGLVTDMLVTNAPERLESVVRKAAPSADVSAPETTRVYASDPRF